MDSGKLVTILKALADPTRLNIVALLNTRSCCVCELVPIFGISQPAISKHLSRLKQANLVSETRKGMWVIYSLNREPLEYVRAVLGELPDMTEDFKRLEAEGLLVSCDD
ncbi:ArsR/SmtB family transcription factor [Brevibacillus migulae]|uniref:ArsR/SmtB family transcription factor n=1 Tax=Brevibacillus migulae TaxID=1644114 RepID=UPI00106E672E|nr:metalloregulator ArsR/SmtB family transcription factor [Brevibacillus migulae]